MNWVENLHEIIVLYFVVILNYIFVSEPDQTHLHTVRITEKDPLDCCGAVFPQTSVDASEASLADYFSAFHANIGAVTFPELHFEQVLLVRSLWNELFHFEQFLLVRSLWNVNSFRALLKLLCWLNRKDMAYLLKAVSQGLVSVPWYLLQQTICHI